MGMDVIGRMVGVWKGCVVGEKDGSNVGKDINGFNVGIFDDFMVGDLDGLYVGFLKYRLCKLKYIHSRIIHVNKSNLFN